MKERMRDNLWRALSGKHNLYVASKRQLKNNLPEPIPVSEMVELLGWGELDGEA